MSDARVKHPNEGRRLTPKRVALLMVGGFLALIAAGFFAASLGSSGPNILDILLGQGSPVDEFKLYDYRLPRMFAALLVGACLALAGTVFQALIHNPLASPYILGVSAGGSLGAVAALALGLSITVVPASFLGCVLAVVTVYLVARSNGRVVANTLLLSGVVVNTFFSACIMLIVFVVKEDQSVKAMRWLIGGIAPLYELDLLYGSAGLVVLTAAFMYRDARAMNLIALGDDFAHRTGVDVVALRRRLFLLGSLLTAIGVSISGPIGFVGLIVPHILRLIVGPDHRVLLPLSLVWGGVFLMVADALAQSIGPSPLPVGLLTALMGAPFFVWLMKSRQLEGGGYDV